VSCDKTEPEIVIDDILFEQINKTILVHESDSRTGICKALIFEITSENQTEPSAILKINSNTDLICCGGYNSVLTDSNAENVIPLNDSFDIAENLNWNGINDLNLDGFAGNGEKYIAYRVCYLPDGIEKFKFGWIKIRLSINKDTLTIISRATNQSNNLPIKTGQMN